MTRGKMIDQNYITRAINSSNTTDGIYIDRNSISTTRVWYTHSNDISTTRNSWNTSARGHLNSEEFNDLYQRWAIAAISYIDDTTKESKNTETQVAGGVSVEDNVSNEELVNAFEKLMS